MKKLTSKQVVIFLSLVLTAIVGVGWYYLFLTGFSFLFMIPGLVIYFVIVFYIIQFAINSFIIEKIRPLYKIINFIPHQGSEAKIKFIPGFVELAQVEQDVEKWAQNQIQEIERLKELERYRKDFVGNVSHELKTPIFNIQGYILTLIDYATRYPEATALKDITAETVAEAMVNMFSRVGVPREILSQFMSGVTKEVSRLLSVRQLVTSPYHPSCNGLVEKLNGTIKAMLKRMCAEKPRDWDRYIGQLLFAY